MNIEAHDVDYENIRHIVIYQFWGVSLTISSDISVRKRVSKMISMTILIWMSYYMISQHCLMKIQKRVGKELWRLFNSPIACEPFSWLGTLYMESYWFWFICSKVKDQTGHSNVAFIFWEVLVFAWLTPNLEHWYSIRSISPTRTVLVCLKIGKKSIVFGIENSTIYKYQLYQKEGCILNLIQ